MRLTPRCLLKFLLLPALLGSIAYAEPVRVESRNVVLYGDVNPRHAEDFVRQMEIYRRMIFALSGKDTATPDPRKLTVHGFNSQSGVQGFAGRDDIGGVYTLSQDGPIFLTPIKSRRDREGWANFVALHEYGHHVLHDIVEDSFPRWYDEGFANYLATLQISDDLITVGAPTVPAAEAFSARVGWLSPYDVIGAVSAYPRHSGGVEAQRKLREHFYAQSWLYVHYLQSHPELGGKLPDYLANLRAGMNPTKAFEEGFGITVTDFHALAEAYWDENAFGVVSFEPQGDFMDVAVTVEPISKSALALAQLPAQMAFMRDGKQKSLSKRIKAAAKEHAGDPVLQYARATLAIGEEDYGEALALAETALAGDPDNILLHRTLADARFHLLQSGGANADLPDGALRTFPTGEMFDAMEAGFAKVLAELPDDRLAVTHMLTAFAMSDAPMTEAAKAAALSFEDSYRDGSPYRALDLAIVHHKGGRVEHACSYLRYARGAIDDPNRKLETWQKSQLAYAESRVGPDCTS